MPSREDIAREAEERLGASLKKWRLESLLGIGGMAAVYRGVHRNGKRVAIKVLHQHLTADRSVRSRFLREGYIANAVQHPAVVGVDDDEVEGETAFLVAELVDGETLEQLRKRAGGKLASDAMLPIVAELLDVLAVAHDAGIVHRDIKPENLMVTRDGGLKVLDFGLARARDVLAHEADLTGPGSLLGTPHFAAPEQAAGRWNLVDARTDLWAVGATMFRLLTGHYVHEGASSQEVLAHAATEPAPSLRAHLTEAPEKLVELVDRSLAFAKADRFTDARDMLAAIEAVANELGVTLPERHAPRDDGAPTEIDDRDSAVGSRAPVQREAAPASSARSWLFASLVAVGVAVTVISLQERDEPNTVESEAAAVVAAAGTVRPQATLRATPRPAPRPTVRSAPPHRMTKAEPPPEPSASAAPAVSAVPTSNPLDRRK